MRIDKVLLAAGIALSATSFHAGAQSESNDGYWQSAPGGTIWKSPFGVCWRSGSWTPAMANSECDPDLVPRPAPVAPVAPAPAAAPPAPVAPAPAPAPVAKPAPPKPTVITLKSSELFEFNKATLAPGARKTIDEQVIAKLPDIRDIRFINVNGHSDRLGSAQYNQKLSEKRAESVKAYLVSKGVDGSKIETFGYGKTMPVKSCADQKSRKALIECLAPNRRVEVEVQGGPQ